MLFSYETNRLVLKILTPDAAPMVLDFFLRDKELFEKYEPERTPNFYTLQFQSETLQYEYNLACKNSHIRFYVFRKENPNQIIGTVCFHKVNLSVYRSCEVGYKFSSEFQHKGYAAEALEKGIDIIFTELMLHRIMAWVEPSNTPSIRLLLSLGFSFEGINRERLYLHGHWADHAQYSLINPLPLHL